MSAPTVPLVRAWRTVPLEAAADRLLRSAAVVEQEAEAVRHSFALALGDAGGEWAIAAEDRAAAEARTGLALADALQAAAERVRAGADDLAAARARLLDVVDRARSDGFDVASDGQVTDPEASPPLEALGAALDPQAAAQARRLEEQRATYEAEVLDALAAVGDADESLARSLTDLSFPQTLESALAAHRARTAELGDPVAALGTAGGAVALARTATDVRRLVVKGAALHRYLQLSRQPALAGTRSLDDALRAFTHGTASHPVLKGAGRLFLPSTLASGAVDAATGGGYDGARGWASRGFGVAGAVGSGALLAGSFSLVALTPVGAGIAGVAVLSYGAWTAGNYVVDHWDQVEDLSEAAVAWTGEQTADAAAEVVDAVDWAQDRLATAGSDVLAGVGELFG